MKIFTRAQITAKIEHFIKQHGTATAAGYACGVYPYQMHVARRNKGPISPKTLAAIGVEKATFYVDHIDPATQDKEKP